jgi:nucleoside-diphosphate-sugar epimerase
VRARGVLVTGAGGYIGARTALRILEESDRNVVLWLHASDIEVARAKAVALAPAFAAYESRISFAHGELDGPEPFSGVDVKAIEGIVHSAAVTRFNVDADTADRVNLRGAEKVFTFAEHCPSLDRITYVGTLHASGLRAGSILEEFVPEEAFANHYERSKHQAERALTTRFAHLPWSIARVATVIADDEGGAPTQQNAVHNTLKLFFYGLVSLVPGKPETPLYFVTRDFVADCLAALALRAAPRGVYHVCHEREDSVTLDDLISIAFEAFEESSSFRTRRVLKPLYVDIESFDDLIGGTDAFMGDVVRQALKSVAPFARQLFVTKAFRNARLRAAHPAYRAPDARALVRATCAHLVKTRWGKA